MTKETSKIKCLFDLHFHISVHYLRKTGQKRKQGRNLEAGADADTVKECCLLACFPCLTHSVFLWNLGVIVFVAVRRHGHSSSYKGKHLIRGYLFRGLVHYHHSWIHGSMQADMVVKKEQRVLHSDSQAAGTESEPLSLV